MSLQPKLATVAGNAACRPGSRTRSKAGKRFVSRRITGRPQGARIGSCLASDSLSLPKPLLPTSRDSEALAGAKGRGFTATIPPPLRRSNFPSVVSTERDPPKLRVSWSCPLVHCDGRRHGALVGDRNPHRAFERRVGHPHGQLRIRIRQNLDILPRQSEGKGLSDGFLRGPATGDLLGGAAVLSLCGGEDSTDKPRVPHGSRHALDFDQIQPYSADHISSLALCNRNPVLNVLQLRCAILCLSFFG